MVSQALPHDIDSEESVLGCILMAWDYEWVAPVYGILKPADFYRERNGWVLDACYALKKRGTGIDQVTVAHELAERDKLEDVGGPAYLSYLVSRVPTPFHAPYYAEIVRDCALRRQMIVDAGKLAAEAYQGRSKKEQEFKGFTIES